MTQAAGWLEHEVEDLAHRVALKASSMLDRSSAAVAQPAASSTNNIVTGIALVASGVALGLALFTHLHRRA